MANSKKDKLSTTDEEVKLISREMNKRKILISRLKRKLLKHVWLLRVLIVLGLVVVFYFLINFSGQLIKKTKIPYYFNLASNFIFTPKGIVDEINGRTNILILGKGGEGHDAPDLTDTILFLSLNNTKKNITMISLPRDIWLPELRTKLNSVYYWGNKREEGGGLILAKSSVEEILGQQVHYAAVLDFSGFKTIIDVLGGVEVDVETPFTDEKYPIPGLEDDLCDGDTEYKCRYETLHFVQGKQVMDGETALKFARSRNAEGDEGTDFARQKRQQKIIKAIEEKILDKETFLSPKTLSRLMDTFLSNLETDILEEEGAVLVRNFLDSKDDVNSFILPEEMLVNPPKSVKYDNLYVFIPRGDDWSEVHAWTICILEGGDCP